MYDLDFVVCAPKCLAIVRSWDLLGVNFIYLLYKDKVKVIFIMEINVRIGILGPSKLSNRWIENNSS
jgi:hypothetical protein